MKNHIEHTMRIISGIATLFAVLIYADVLGASNISIIYINNKLTADVSNAPLKSVLEELSIEYGMIVLVEEAIKDRAITVKFKNLAVEKAIKRLIHPYSSATIFSKRFDSYGRKELFISELKVFESGTGEAPQYMKVLPTNMEQETLKKEISRLEISILDAKSDNERKKKIAEFSDKVRELHRLHLEYYRRLPFIQEDDSTNETYNDFLDDASTASDFDDESFDAVENQQDIDHQYVKRKISLISYLRAKMKTGEEKLKKEIAQLERSILKAVSDNERKKKITELSDKVRKLHSFQTEKKNRILLEERVLRIRQTP